MMHFGNGDKSSTQSALLVQVVIMAQQARQYAQRNREGSNWFSHDGDAVKPPASEPVKPDSESPTSAAPAASEVPATAVVEDNVDQSTTATEAAATEAAAPAPARAQMIKPKCDSNEWLVVVSSCCAVIE